MSDGSGSSNTAIVAILVFVVLILGFLYYMGIFGPGNQRSNTTIIEQPSIEAPSLPRSTNLPSTTPGR